MRWLKRIALTVLVIILLFVAGIGLYLYQKSAFVRLVVNSWVFKENKPGPTIGDLGGIPVSIPRSIARFVEYEGEPHLYEPRTKPTPVRTFQSKLRSFGFEVRFPDMALLTDKTFEDKHKSNIYNTMWLSVGVGVAPYNNALGLKRRVDAIPYPSQLHELHESEAAPGLPARTWKEEHGYIRSPTLLYGLVVNEVQGYDEAKRYNIPGNDMGDYNIYYHFDEQGNVDAYIRCDNIKHGAAPCNHDFILPKAINTIINVHYRIGLLPQWRDIQEAVGKTILGFSVSPNPVLNGTKPNTPSTSQP
jgi:hypothetical protein